MNERIAQNKGCMNDSMYLKSKTEKLKGIQSI